MLQASRAANPKTVAEDARLPREIESFARFEPRIPERAIQEDPRMRTSALAISAAFALAAAPMSFAQRSAEPSPRTPSAQTVSVSDADLETFATIYADLLDTADKFEAEINLAQTEAQAREIEGRAQTESLAKIAKRGWTPERFNSVSEAIQSDPELTDKAVKLIEAK